MSYKGCNIVDTMIVREVVTELICDIIVDNAKYMHDVRVQMMPILLQSAKSGRPAKVVNKLLNSFDKRMMFLYHLFQRHSDFLAPLKLIKDT